MTPFERCRTGIAVAALLATTAAFAATMTKSEYAAAKDRIEADFKAEKSSCDQSSGNAKDVCKQRASGNEKVARAELEYRQSGLASDGNKVAVATADAHFAVSRELCDDQAGQAKSVCVTEAKTTHTKALADAKLNRQVSVARSDAAGDKRDADYQLAIERCDSLAGETKASCLDAAKVKFGKS
jgi:hypothetical protein